MVELLSEEELAEAHSKLNSGWNSGHIVGRQKQLTSAILILRHFCLVSNTFNIHTKGQLISKAIFLVLNSSKKNVKEMNCESTET